MGFYYSATVKGKIYNSGNTFICDAYSDHGYSSSDGGTPLSIPLYAGKRYVFKYYADYSYSRYRYGIAFDPTEDYSPYYANYNGISWDIGWFDDVCFKDETYVPATATTPAINTPKTFTITYYDIYGKIVGTQTKTAGVAINLWGKNQTADFDYARADVIKNYTCTYSYNNLSSDKIITIPETTSYIFAGWQTANIYDYSFDAPYNIDADLLLYPRYSMNKVLAKTLISEPLAPGGSVKYSTTTYDSDTRITYDANGGSGTLPADFVFNYYCIYTFSHWIENTTKTKYLPKTSIPITANKKFTGVWVASNKAPQISIDTIYGPKLIKSGYQFKGWGLNKTSKEIIPADFTPASGQTIVLYAIWDSINEFDGKPIVSGNSSLITSNNSDLSYWHSGLLCDSDANWISIRNKIYSDMQSSSDKTLYKNYMSYITSDGTSLDYPITGMKLTSTQITNICKFYLALAKYADTYCDPKYKIATCMYAKVLSQYISDGFRNKICDGGVKINIEGLLKYILSIFKQ